MFYFRKKWQDNCNEERLLGVSLTGIMDNKNLILKEKFANYRLTKKERILLKEEIHRNLLNIDNSRVYDHWSKWGNGYTK